MKTYLNLSAKRIALFYNAGRERTASDLGLKSSGTGSRFSFYLRFFIGDGFLIKVYVLSFYSIYHNNLFILCHFISGSYLLSNKSNEFCNS